MEVETRSSTAAGDGGGQQQESAAASSPSLSGREEAQKIPAAAPAAANNASSVEALLSVPLSLIMRELPKPAGADVPSGHHRRRGGVGVGVGVGLGGDVGIDGRSGVTAAAAASPAPRIHPRRRTLLSRSEASVLLRVSQLAIEHDVLVDLAFTALQNANMCASFRKRIEQSCVITSRSTRDGKSRQHQRQQAPLQYPTRYLLPLLPILSVHANTVQNRAIQHVSTECNRVLAELSRCCTTLRQFAEQNWTVSEHLYMDGSGGVGGVGRDKGSLAEIEEAICDRIDGLVGMAVGGGGSTDVDAACGGPNDATVDGVEKMSDANKDKTKNKKRKRGKDEGGSPQDVFDASVDLTTGKFVSMAELCRRLFTDVDERKEENVSSGCGDTSAHNVQDMELDKPSVDAAAASSTKSSAVNGDLLDEGKIANAEVVPIVVTNEISASAPGSGKAGETQHPNRKTDGTTGTGHSAGGNDSASNGSVNNVENGDNDEVEESSDNPVEMGDGKEDEGPRDGSASSSSPEHGQLTQCAAATLAVLASGSQTY